ncbi:hypothetical protein FACS1894181_10200 [Bacteroidia bacterium]|nr:hypothetical protein FACS1894181_10200 [Bacteroidia bacterium]
MTKYRFLVSLLLLAGLAASCSKDDLNESQNAENNRVVLTVNAGDAQGAVLKSAPQLRSASGDLQLAGYSLRYICEVFKESGNGVSFYREERLVTDASQPENFEFDVPDAGGYGAVLWADYVADDASKTYAHYDNKFYTTGYMTEQSLRYIQINPVAYAVNTPARDAFFAKKIFTKVAGTPLNLGDITLKRPFGRINIIETDEAMRTNLNYINISYKVPLTFRPLTGAISGEQTVALNNIQSFPDASAEKANLFYDYVFAPESGQHLLPAITVQYVMQGNPTVNTSTIPANMPVERNKRTNISGNLIINTSATSLSVELDDAWTTPDINN